MRTSTKNRLAIAAWILLPGALLSACKATETSNLPIGSGGSGASGGSHASGGGSASSGGSASGGNTASGGSSASSGGSGTAGRNASGGTPGASGGRGGTVGTGGAGTGGMGTGGTTGSAGATASCSAGSTSTITSVMNGGVATGNKISLSGVVATSPKFLASKGSAGDCLWGVFISEPVAQAVAYSGALLLVPGKPAIADASGTFGACPTGTDEIPNDTAPGDVFNATANVRSYVKATCASTATPPPAPEIRLGDGCAVRRTSKGHALPTPATVSPLTDLTNAATATTHQKWTGVLIKLTGVTATGAVGSTGSIGLTNGLRVRDRIYQGAKTAVFAAGTTWTSIVGISHLDVCTWSIEPRDPCTDFVPKSQNCP